MTNLQVVPGENLLRRCLPIETNMGFGIAVPNSIMSVKLTTQPQLIEMIYNMSIERDSYSATLHKSPSCSALGAIAWLNFFYDDFLAFQGTKKL